MALICGASVPLGIASRSAPDQQRNLADKSAPGQRTNADRGAFVSRLSHDGAGLLWQRHTLRPFTWLGERHPRVGQCVAGKRVAQHPRRVVHLGM